MRWRSSILYSYMNICMNFCWVSWVTILPRGFWYFIFDSLMYTLFMGYIGRVNFDLNVILIWLYRWCYYHGNLMGLWRLFFREWKIYCSWFWKGRGVFVFEVVFYLYRVVVCSIYRKVSFNITKPRFYLPCIT